ALHSQSDTSAFFDVHIDGYQNTLYTHTHRQFYGSSIISGTVDFIFGDVAVIIQNCLIIFDDFIQPDGWLLWQGTFALDTCFYGEYANVGGAAGTDRRAKWKGFLGDLKDRMSYAIHGVGICSRERMLKGLGMNVLPLYESLLCIQYLVFSSSIWSKTDDRQVADMQLGK
ncbi:pectinesterase-like protein, partial [Tanacetum coccineum]